MAVDGAWDLIVTRRYATDVSRHQFGAIVFKATGLDRALTQEGLTRTFDGERRTCSPSW